MIIIGLSATSDDPVGNEVSILSGPGLSFPGVFGSAMATPDLGTLELLTLTQTEGADYVHHITTGHQTFYQSGVS